MNPSAPASFDRQYRSLRSGCGIVELANWSSVTVTGRDRQTFVHNFCTNDVKRLTRGESCEAFFTNVKGKIVGHGLVTCRDQELTIIGPPDQASRLISHLDRYLIREDVQLRDTTSERSYVLVSGGNSVRKHLAKHDAHRPAGAAPILWFPWNLVGSEFAGVVESPAHEQLGMDIGCPEGECIAVGPQAFNTARIEAGVPLIGVDFDDQNLPQEVGRSEQAISFTKGCYLGQETVARIDALGHVNQQLVGVRFSGDDVPEIGVLLSAGGKAVGQVTSATFSPQLHAPLTLAMLRRPYHEAGSRLDSSLGSCEVVRLPVEAASSN